MWCRGVLPQRLSRRSDRDLAAGARVADVGCGHGHSTVIMAEALRPDGTVMLVEPFANDRVEQNLTPIGRHYTRLSRPAQYGVRSFILSTLPLARWGSASMNSIRDGFL